MAKATVEIGANTTKLKAGLQRSQQDVKNWKNGVSSSIKSLKNDIAATGKGGGLAGFIGANKSIIGITAIIAGVKSLASEVDELQDTADATGLSMNSLSKLGIIFGEGGVKATELRKVLVSIATAQGDVIGGSKEAAKKFAALGIAQDTVKKSSPEQMLEAVTKAMAGQNSVQEAMSKGLPLLGAKNSRFAATAMRMGKDYKGAMDDVKGALTDEDAQKIAQNMDKIETAMQGAKNTLTNFGGEAIGGLEKFFAMAGKISVGADSPEGPVLDEGEETVSMMIARNQERQKAVKIQQEAEAATKATAKAEEDAADAAKERADTIKQLQDESEQLYQDQKDGAVDALSLDEKQNYWVMKQLAAQEQLNAAKGDELQYEQAKLNLAKANAAIADTQAKRIEKQAAENMKTPQERAQGRREARAQARAQKKAKRQIEAKDADEADRIRRGAKPDKSNMAGMMAAQGQKPEMTHSDKILEDIRSYSEKQCGAIESLAARVKAH